MASGGVGNSSGNKAKMEEGKDEGLTGAEVAVGVAALGVAALAASGISKLFGSSGPPEKMMKAPGRDYYMPRKDFLGDPSAYFRGLHGKK